MHGAAGIASWSELAAQLRVLFALGHVIAAAAHRQALVLQP